jgi:hypothetical protein
MTYATPDTSDGFHTFTELYRYRTLYHALWLNVLFSLSEDEDLNIHKSWLHDDGKPPFGGGWFIVMVTLPTGQVSNHYPAEDWDKFQIPEREHASEWDGHTPAIAADRMDAYLVLTATYEDYR